jgi:hypothetical protein
MDSFERGKREKLLLLRRTLYYPKNYLRFQFAGPARLSEGFAENANPLPGRRDSDAARSERGKLHRASEEIEQYGERECESPEGV